MFMCICDHTYMRIVLVLWNCVGLMGGYMCVFRRSLPPIYLCNSLIASNYYLAKLLAQRALYPY